MIIFLIMTSPLFSSGQINKSDSIFLNREDIETIETYSELDANKAAILSAVLPGMGQAYNNQYWKIPIIYGGGILIGHYINYNHKIYNEFRNALIAEADGIPATINPYSGRFSSDALQRNRDAFRRNRDMLILIAGAFYLLNIVDAHVSAHLHEFDINENLSMKVSPSIQPTPLFSQAVGLSVSLRLK
ncbi:MAG: hypothetical protein CMB80_30460 [Flammeovirgaceae bacterium]|nr:hypothetical protein [Flammeovirgaceae bacterium]MBE60856.1 hypothetical protein [Flammeovirgaceae bacterium]HCX21497.1 hypothetical protein [Cytophagales bacterium]|tara:strand:- start:7172 stop:7735 length:564 start_codon:yes stop_codon:yes gene_type:complete